MHLVIYFFSTREGHPSLDNPYFSFGEPEDTHYLYDNENIATLAVKGCWHKDVCNDEIFPNLSDFAKRFVGKLFPHPDKNTLTLDNTVFDAGNNTIGLYPNFCSGFHHNLDITEITLCGYSRGAVTCFEVARELNKITKVPVNIVANQPVPGSLCAAPGTNAASVMDCRDITNLKNVSIILGTSTTTDLTHRAFYNQIVPKLPINTKKEIIAIPKKDHYAGPDACKQDNIPFGEKHLHMQVAKYLHESNVVPLELVEEKTERAKNAYSEGERNYVLTKREKPQNFPQFDKVQTFFGITNRQLYRYRDTLHPTPYLFDGYEYEWNSDKSLMNWWSQHDRENSHYKSGATDHLITMIESTNDHTDTPSMLITLFRSVENWLIEKEDAQSSRYWLVMALRNHIYHKLTKIHNVTPGTLEAMSQELKHENKYFQKHWNVLSTAASFFKTEATKTLDENFEKHANNEINDEVLLVAINNWLQQKEDCNSKRWDIVLEMKEMLEEAIQISASNHNLINT